MLGVGGIVSAKVSQKRKGVFGDDVEHFFGFKVLEAGPAQVVVVAFAVVFAFGEDSPLDRFLETIGFVFFQRVEIVQSSEE